MDELNKLVNNLTVSYGSYNTCKNKKTAASLRKELQKLKAYATLQRKDVLNSVKPVTPIVIEFVVPPAVQPSLKKVKKLKDEVKDELKNEVVGSVEIIEPVEPPLKKLKKNKKVVEPVKSPVKQSLKVVFPVS
jgi:hypothetical protein